uniref:Bm14350 n=1 Tax=Brugia malayi TaxID=6279 RepID=A0A0J9Y504_BRUMA|nr:Bm14350 [Brugia malayi]
MIRKAILTTYSKHDDNRRSVSSIFEPDWCFHFCSCHPLSLCCSEQSETQHLVDKPVGEASTSCHCRALTSRAKYDQFGLDYR